MNSQTPSSPLSQPDADALLWNALPNLVLNIAQTADLCGISVRQLGYWTKQGYVAASGRGARRCYGLDSIRRLLAIRDAMNRGLSLRQSLRLVAALPSLPLLSAVSARPSEEGEQTQSGPLPVYAEALAQNLLALFHSNVRIRDNVSGLAMKLGRSENDVRAVAEQLCARGLLARSEAPGGLIFERAGGRSA